VRALKIFLLVPLLTACPSTSSSDAGTDALVTPDAPLACEPDAGPPLDAGDEGPIQPMQATHAPFQNACSLQQIKDYAQCQGAKNTDLCMQFKPGQPGEACGKCIETPYSVDSGAPEWGVIVFNGSTAFVNIEGCVNQALGTFDCGSAMHALYQCEEISCSGCSGTDFGNCELESAIDPGYCEPLAHAVNPCEGASPDAGCVPTGPCAAIFSPSIPCTAQNCFPNAACDDSTRQQVDFLERIVGYMCGAPTTDCPVTAPDHCP